MTTFLGDWGQRKQFGREIKRIGKHDTEWIEIQVFNTVEIPDGTEGTGERIKLLPGIPYSLPASVAKILLEKGQAKRV